MYTKTNNFTAKKPSVPDEGSMLKNSDDFKFIPVVTPSTKANATG